MTQMITKYKCIPEQYYKDPSKYIGPDDITTWCQKNCGWATEPRSSSGEEAQKPQFLLGINENRIPNRFPAFWGPATSQGAPKIAPGRGPCWPREHPKVGPREGHNLCHSLVMHWTPQKPQFLLGINEKRIPNRFPAFWGPATSPPGRSAGHGAINCIYVVAISFMC